jgi:hypothetical protein
MQNGNQSEVARLKQDIEAGYQAGKLALHGFAEVASHERINRSMEGMWSGVEKLERVAGKEEAKRFLMGLH